MKRRRSLRGLRRQGQLHRRARGRLRVVQLAERIAQAQKKPLLLRPAPAAPGAVAKQPRRRALAQLANQKGRR